MKDKLKNKKIFTKFYKVTFIVFCFFGVFNFANALIINSNTLNAGGDTLKNGLVGHWTFDGADLVSNVVDKSGNGNTGNMVNMATSSAKAGGVLGQALKFDGVNDYIRVPHSTSYKSNNQAISFWMYPLQIPSSGYDGVLGMITNDSNAFEVFMDNSTSVLSAGSYPWQLTYTIPKKNVWYHVYVETVSGVGKIYINGVLQDTGNVAYGGASNTADFYIGSRNTTYFFPGYLDDVRVYNRALSASEIKQQYNQGGSKLNSQTLNAGGDMLKQGLVSWWTFDGADLVSNVVDRGSAGNTGNLVNMSTSTAKVPGALGQALKFDGSDDYVDIADVDASLASNSSISVWINPRSVSVSHRIFGGRTNSAPVVGIYPSPYGIIASGATQGNQRTGSTSTIKLNAWNHLVVTYGATSIPTIYVNGVEVTYTASTYWGATNSTIGKAGGNTFQGIIDDVRLYSRVLTSKEIKQLYNQGGSKITSQTPNAGGDSLKSGLVAHWTFDGADLVSNVADKSGNGNNGNLVGFTSTTTAKTGGVLGQALKFDGVDDYVSIPNNLSSYFTNQEATFNVWLKKMQHTPSSSGNTGSWYFNASDANNHYVWTDGSIYDGTFKTTRDNVGAGLISNRKNWHMVTITRKAGANGWNYYQNGRLAYSTSGGTWDFATSNYKIGESASNTYNFFGVMDDVRLYNRVLSASEIQKLYNMGR